MDIIHKFTIDNHLQGKMIRTNKKLCFTFHTNFLFAISQNLMFKVFISFLQNPRVPVARKETKVLGTSLKIWLLLEVISGLIVLFNTGVLGNFFDIPIDKTYSLPARYQNNVPLFLISISLFVPLMEEVIFRLSLIFNHSYLALIVSVPVALFTYKHSNGAISIILMLACYSLVYYFAFKHKSVLSDFWNRNFRYLFYISALIFAAGHAFNFTYQNTMQYAFIPLLVLPQFVSGITQSFVRVYYTKGFVMSLVIHCIMNTAFAVINLHQFH